MACIAKSIVQMIHRMIQVMKSLSLNLQILLDNPYSRLWVLGLGVPYFVGPTCSLVTTLKMLSRETNERL